jgi:carboxyl-terminal processing protease
MFEMDSLIDRGVRFMPRRNLVALMIVAILSILGLQAGLAAQRDEGTEMYGLFVDAVEQVESNYVRSVSRKELLESALKGMLQHLDPHSSYINNTEWKQFRGNHIEGKFGGIGIQIQIDPDTRRLIVAAPMVGTPAYNAGVLPGDEILQIDDQSTEDLDLDKVVELLQGRPGTKVKLLIRHEQAEKPETITLSRAIIDVPSVLGDSRKADDSWDFMLDKENKIGYIRITSFVQNTYEELKKAVEELKEQGMKALILDLRSNPGGLLSVAVDVSDLFVEEGRIVSTKGRNSPEKVFEAHKEGTYSGFPMAILINHGSASASEIVSACLQDHDRAVIVGERSFGKGSVQNIIELDDGASVLKLTVATYWRPSGKNIHRFKNATEKDEWGVKPNDGMEVKFTIDDFIAWAKDRKDRDRQVHGLKPKGAAGDAKDEKKPEQKAEKKDDKKSEPKPFVDRQLNKALEVVKQKLTGEAKEQAKEIKE